ncbi:hypothetical protein [Flavobacterium sp. KBS0721]|uniref:hypothetical protein n=1 Tax=Flavobacterium sp. KBS0721 TaxID=1179672 RepID=UPI00098F1067|nr:hypothetical protein [Flavobacterium sp. KBS0721]QDW19245.1 hypothetical protein B0M43_0003685 [Flavobacterium sp. KBS0721]
MKKIVIVFCILILTASCKSQNEDFTLIGKWKPIESTGSNGANKFTTKIEDGNEITFEKNNIVIDHLNNKGKYEFTGDSLHLVFDKEEFYYFCRTDKRNAKKMSLDPVNAEYQFICDEGCSTIYKKTE